MDQYQDAYLPDRVEPGDRDCAERWQLIAPHLPDRGILVDVGSNLGYYGLRAIEAKAELAVVSIEPDSPTAERQRAIAAAHGTDRLCLVEGSINAHTAKAWARTCDWVDLTLLLAVLHWMDDPASIVRELSSMSGRIIVEVPDADDDGACGRSRSRQWAGDPVAWFREASQRQVRLIGRPQRHTSDVPSHLLLIDGPTERRPERAYWDAVFPHPEASDYRIAYDGEHVQLTVRGQDIAWVPGINLVTLMKLGRLVYPATSVFRQLGEQAIRTSTRHGDPLPHNMLWSARGIELIDEDDQQTGITPQAAEEQLDRSLDAWERGQSVARDAYIRQVLGPVRYVRRQVGVVLRRVLSDRAVESIKTTLRL